MSRASLYLALTALIFLASMTSSGLNQTVGAGRIDEAAARAAARNPEAVLVRIATKSESDRDRATGLGTVVADYGTSVVVAANAGILEGARRPNGFAAKLDLDVVPTIISLRGFQFDPLRDDPARALAGGGATRRRVTRRETTISSSSSLR